VPKPDQDNGGQPWKATAKDLLAVIRGKATDEQKKLVQDALADPYSEVSEFCREVEEWAKKRFPSAGSSRPAKASLRPLSRAKERLDAVLEFVRQKHIEGVFTMDEVAKFAKAGPGATDFSGPPLSLVECNSLAIRIIRAIEEAHPELTSEMAKFRSDRRR
jgi:hypothetical protein